jgi:hypothetical protein
MFVGASKQEINTLRNHPLLLGIALAIGILILGLAVNIILIRWQMG